jgi:hypothetical protein
MADNLIVIEFDPCEPPPANGYRIGYRHLGSSAPFTIVGSIEASPVSILVTTDPDGQDYEGFIQGDCGGGKFGPAVFWATEPGSQEAPSEVGPSDASGGGPVPECRTYVMTATVGTPSAHYRDCGGTIRDTLITDHTEICTDGTGFTISGGGITIDSFTDGDC